MSGPYIPPGFAPTFAESVAGGGPGAPLVVPLDVLKGLPGAFPWAFDVVNLSGNIAIGNPITNLSFAANNFFVPGGFEALITHLRVGPNMFPGTIAYTWVAQLTVNGVPIPGFEWIQQLPESDGIGNHWTTLDVLVPENSLIELRKAGDNFGTALADIGGRVQGWTWPVAARQEWERHERRVK